MTALAESPSWPVMAGGSQVGQRVKGGCWRIRRRDIPGRAKKDEQLDPIIFKAFQTAVS